MENLSFAQRLDPEPATSFDDDAASPEVRVPRRPRTYRAASVLDHLSAYAAVFDCSAGCAAALA